MRTMGLVWVGVCVAGCLVARAQGGASGPAGLQVDNLTRPLGIDDITPRFSWKLNDPAHGARQTAYRVLVATQEGLLADGKTDVWDSGKVNSGRSLNVKYAGPAVKPSTRYWWRVEVSGQDGKPYPASTAEYWETGLLTEGWRGEWLGWETAEEAAVRKAPSVWIANPDVVPGAAQPSSEQRFGYRASLQVEKPVERAVLFATGEDTVASWVNGAKVMTVAAYPPYHHLPWKKFVRADVTAQIAAGQNTIAIESVHYIDKYGEKRRKDAPPMIATVVVLYKDGTTAEFGSDGTWKSAASPAEGWEKKDFDDASWKSAVVWMQKGGPEEQPVLQPWIPDSVKVLWKSFEAEKPVKSARLYATALGTYELHLNHERVGDSVMAPGWTDYRERVLYQTYDVTPLVKSGANVIEALLAPGWYSTSLEWLQQPNNYGDTPPALRAQLRIEYADGRVEWVGTDTNWKADTSFIVHSELYDGETQDLRELYQTFNRTGVDAEPGKQVTIVHPKEIKIEAQAFPSIGIDQALTVVKMTEPKPGDFHLRPRAEHGGRGEACCFGSGGHRRAGAGGRSAESRWDAVYRESEDCEGDGSLHSFRAGNRCTRSAFHFSWVPVYRDHGSEECLRRACCFCAGVTHGLHFTAKLKTGNEMINKLWSNILWGQRSNFVGLPTDCPQRDERLGWSADAQVFWRAASYNAALASFTRKFAADLRGTQVGTPYYGIYAPGTAKISPGIAAAWSDAGVIIPWTSWLQTGDTSVIDENWAAMRKYVDAIDARNPDGIWHNDSGIPFGDWLSLEGRTQEDLVATAYWAYDVNMMRQMAHATGRTEEEQRYAKLEDKIRNAFQAKFVKEKAYIPGADNSPSPFGDINNPNAKAKGGDTQTSYVLALHMNLLPDEMRAQAAGRLVKKIEDNHGLLGTGFVGTPYILEELTKTGHTKLAYDLLLSKGMPSWGYVIEHGGTTTWERWNGDEMMGDPQMNSYNHYAYGAVADWIYRFAAGVDASPLNAGFHTVVLHPVFDARLSPLEFSYASSYGEIKSSWTVKGKTAEWNVTLPANTTGLLEVKGNEAARYKVDGVRLSESPLAKKIDGGFELAAGSYRFEVVQ